MAAGGAGQIDLRWAEGRDDRSVEIAADFVRLKVDGIVKYSDVQARIAKQATSTIPIVATLLENPVGSGLVASFASVYRLATTRQHRCAGNCEILVAASEWGGWCLTIRAWLCWSVTFSHFT